MAAGEAVGTFGEGDGQSVNSMQTVTGFAKLLIGSMVLLCASYGCATNAPVQNQHQAEAQQTQTPKAPLHRPSTPPAPQPVDRILGVQVKEDASGVIRVLISGNGPFQDYIYQRLTRHSFILGLADISKTSSCPGLPLNAHGLQLRCATGKASSGLHLVGTMRRGLGHYQLSSVGNDLILTLYRSGQKPASAANTDQTSGQQTAPAFNKSRVPELGKTAGVPVAASRSFPKSSHRTVSGYETLSHKRSMGFKKNYTGKPISLDLQEADLKNVLRLLADLSEPTW